MTTTRVEAKAVDGRCDCENEACRVGHRIGGCGRDAYVVAIAFGIRHRLCAVCLDDQQRRELTEAR